MENATEKFREGRPNFREDIKLFIGLPKQPLLELSPPVATIHSLVGTEQSLKTTTVTSRTHELKHEYTCMYRSGSKPLVIILIK